MAGLTTLGADDEQSVLTIRRAIALGINFIDTAYSYGIDGRSDRVLAKAIAGSLTPRSATTCSATTCSATTDAQGPAHVPVIASKVGASLDSHGKWQNDARPDRMITQAREILERLELDRVDLMYLHAPDPQVPIEESADALREIQNRGWARWLGVSNVSSSQAETIFARCPFVAIQTHFNMLQPQSVQQLRNFCRANTVSMVTYWALMKGILAGTMPREHRFDPADRRLNYPIYRGEKWELAQQFLDELRRIAAEQKISVAQLVLAWNIAQPGIDVTLVGAKRPSQIEETAVAMNFPLSSAMEQEISALAKRFASATDWTR
jgi:aryl-alcohol dehydrogenase-like predicted oxidoreductase